MAVMLWQEEACHGQGTKEASVARAQRMGEKMEWNETERWAGATAEIERNGQILEIFKR